MSLIKHIIIKGFSDSLIYFNLIVYTKVSHTNELRLNNLFFYNN